MAATRKPRKHPTFLLPAKEGRLVVVYGGKDAEPWLARLAKDVGTTDRTVALIDDATLLRVTRPAGHVYYDFMHAWEAAKDAAERDRAEAEAAMTAAIKRRDIAARVLEVCRQGKGFTVP